MWKVTDIQATDGLITSAKYYVSLEKDGYFADTEGYWHFVEPKATKPFDEVVEADVIGWIQAESAGQIDARLAEQVEQLKAQKKVAAPWMPQIFTPEV